LIDADFGKLKSALFRIFRAVFKNQAHRSFLIAYGFELAVIQFALQPQELAAGLREIDIDRVELLDGCQRGGLTIGN